MKKWLSLAAVVVLCLALVVGVACGGGEEEEEGVKEVKFGWGFPLSGVIGAAFGVGAKNAVTLYNEKLGEFTVGGETYRWNLIFEDTKYTSAGAVAAATKFIFEDGVKFMHMTGGDAGMAAQAICEETGVLLDTVGTPIEAFGPDKPYTFGISSQFMHCTPAFVQWLVTAHPEVKKVAIVQDEAGTGRAFADAAEKAAEYFGFDTVVEYFPSGTTEYYPVATKVMGEDPDLVLAGTDLLTPMWEMGYDGLFGDLRWWNAMAVAPGWDRVQGFLNFMPQWEAAWPTDEVSEFAAEYKSRYGADYGQGEFYACCILAVMTEAIKKAGTAEDVDRIIEVLRTETLDTWVGPLRFGGEEIIGIDNWLLWPVPIMEVRGQGLQTITMIPADEAWEVAVEVYK